jgi:hypothetical protein
MGEYESRYAEFRLTNEQRDSLRRLTKPSLHSPSTAGRLLVETIIVECGERRVVKEEEQGAKLV